MPVLESLALGSIANSAKGFAVDALRFIADHPWPAASIALGAACGWLLFFTIPGLEEERDLEIAAHKETKEGFRQAQRDAWFVWTQDRQRYQAALDVHAQEIQDAQETAKETADALTRALIERRRVRQCPERTAASGDASGPAGGSGSNSAGVSSETSAMSELVALSEQDVRACGELRVYAQKAHEWAISLPSSP